MRSGSKVVQVASFRKSAMPRPLRRVQGAIDGHNHLFRDPGYAEKLIEVCLAQGIARISVSGQGKAYNMHDNAGVLRASEMHPKQLIPFAFFRLGRDAPSLVREFKQQGFRGLKFCGPTVPYDSSRLFPVYERAEEEGLPALFHCGVLAPLPVEKCGAELMRPLRLDGVARRFRGFRILIAHLGVPEFETAATLARLLPNIYVDLTGSPGRGWYVPKKPEFFKELFYWPLWHRKVVFGTDCRHEEIPAAAQEYGRMFSAFELGKEAVNDIYRDSYREFLGEIPARPAGYHSFRMGPGNGSDDAGAIRGGT